MHIPVTVVTDITLLRDGYGIFKSDRNRLLPRFSGCQHFNAVYRLTNIAAASGRDVFDNAVLNRKIHLVLVAHKVKRPAHGFFNVLARNRFELKHS